MKFILSLFATLLLFDAAGQFRSVGIFAFPTFSHQFSTNAADNIKPALGFFSGIHVRWDLLERLAVKSGIEYQINAPTWELENVGANGEVLSPTIAVADVHFLSLPILVQAKFGKRQRGLLQAGYTFSKILLSGAGYRGNPAGFFRPTFTEKEFVHAVVLAAGIEKKLNGGWSFEMLIRSDVGIGSVSTDAVSFRKLRTLSIFPQLGFNYNFFTTED